MAGPKKARDNHDQKTPNQQTNGPQHGQRGTPVSSAKSYSPPPLRGYDGNVSPPPSNEEVARVSGRTLKNLDLSVAQFNTAEHKTVNGMPPRPSQLNSLGSQLQVALNTFPIISYSTKQVHQYAISVGNGKEKRAVIRKMFNCPTVQKLIGDNFIFDGNTLAWSLTKLDKEITADIDLDVEAGKPPRRKANVFSFKIKWTKQVRFDMLQSYMSGKCSFTEDILESIAFLDHLLRETPSNELIAIKRSFFPSNGNGRTRLSENVEVCKGVYSSIRIAHAGLNKPAGLTVNVDVANCAFYVAQSLEAAVREYARCTSIDDFGNKWNQARKSGPHAQPDKTLWRKSNLYQNLKHLKRVGVEVFIPSRKGQSAPRNFIVKDFLHLDPGEKKMDVNVRGSDGRPQLDHQGKPVTKSLSIKQYLVEKYGYTPRSFVPLVEMTKGELFPFECCTIRRNERYPYKLDEKQTSNMIRFAVTLPTQRLADINNGLKMLNWSGDPKLQEYGLRMGMDKLLAPARLLPPPDIVFGGQRKEPGQAAQKAGRWRIDGKQFMKGNTEPLASWGVCLIKGGPSGGNISGQNVAAFFQQFVKIYKGHGGRFANERPEFMEANMSDGGKVIENTWNATGNKFNKRPQILFFVLPFKNTELYHRIKKSGECRFGVVTQCMQSAHVQKNQAQYISNICMKVNAKLGGYTCTAKGSILGTRLDPLFYKVPTIVIGADVSHAAPGVQQGSTAAITMSTNQDLTRYAARCETNGFRVEMISKENINSCMGGLLKWWATTLNRGKLPPRLFYFRDGVSEGQYSQVLKEEVANMKALCKMIDPTSNVQFLVVICSKRHHIRFFPQGNSGDRNGNPYPGTLVETHCTHPFEFDFYLNSHSAIKGTSRPVHYHVLMNEPKLDPQAFQLMIFEHSFQYMRATTPVSLFPAVYYAHIASNRSKAHENKPAASGGKKDAAQMKPDTSSNSDSAVVEVKPLLPLMGGGGLETGMWYI